MKTSRTRVGLSILASSLSFVGSASALDLVIDGSYESSTNNISGVTGVGGDDLAAPDGGWTAFTTYTYAAGYTQPGTTGCGQVYLRPYGDLGGHATVSQIDTLSRAITPAQIDSSTGQYTVSAWFCTYKGQNDYSDFTLQFLDVGMSPVGDPVALGGAAFVAALPGGSGLRGWGRDSRNGVIPVSARYASISTTSHALVNLPDGYVDLVSLEVTNGFVPVQVSTVSPLNNASGVSPGTAVSVTLQDGTAPLNTNSVVMRYDNLVVAASIQQSGNTTIVGYSPPGLQASLSGHTFQIAYGSTGGATPTTTNQFAFTVAPYVNVNLGAPIYLENFDSVAEGALPSGWRVTNFTDVDIPGLDLNNFRSDSYLDWVVISRSTLSNLFGVVPDGGDYVSTLNVAPNQVINGELVTNLIDGNFIFAVSDRDNNQKQIQYLFTSNYNLSGRTNVYLSFHSIWTQNQDSMASVEYSINGGATWLPAQYMLDGPDVLRDSNGAIDASNTFAFIHDDVPNLDAFTLGNGNYGQFIGVRSNLWATLAPYISARVDDDQFESKRVEVIRLAQADNQSNVQVRFATVGTWSWYWGLDNVGFYSLTNSSPPILASSPTPATQTVAAGNSGSLSIGSALGVGPFSYQWRHNGVPMSGRTGQSISIAVVQLTDAGSYDVVVSNGSGSSTSAPPAALLTVINPAVFVTGQWDFNGNLAATVGRDLEYYDATVQSDTTFGTTASFGIPDINGHTTTVMHFVPSTVGSGWGGYRAWHGASPNGGGAYVNQYTLIYDLYYPFGSDLTWRSLWQTDTSNVSDGDLFLNNGYNGIGISGVYDGNVTAGQWHRVAVAFDLTGPGQAPVLTKFIDGVKVGNQTAGLSGPDGRFSLDPSALLFADQDSDLAEGFVSSIQFSNGRRPDAFLAALGGPNALKIAGPISARLQNNQVIITWPGGVPLEGATSVSGPWSVVSGANSPYTVPSPTGAQFYRPKLF